MCATYAAASLNTIQKYFKVKLPAIIREVEPVLHPHSSAPVIIAPQGEMQVEYMNFSLIPSWSTERKPKFATYNARIEEVLTKPSWKEPFATRHCIVVMDQFFEFAAMGLFEGHKIGISAKDTTSLFAAGIWDQWFDKQTGHFVRSFAILTTEPTPQILEAGHDRSPIFLDPDDCTEWIMGRESRTEWLEFLKHARLFQDLSFEQGERMKSYTGQMKLFEEN
ncbi:SOS response-associated peptidase [Bdellovibrio sp. NC01]|uniref:SOS response-associated peptidase n=1 Tax=Bdellovibrio sp. NC01 TaxID=2220073 RepID=UPI00115903B4|nr:SOS response-associated peptidase family protein [Bdellovibrio sp. NC01]QDK38252.1 hypothetical protein DOE51_12010 [Bdellovibrio sp. NC01]